MRFSTVSSRIIQVFKITIISIGIVISQNFQKLLGIVI